MAGMQLVLLERLDQVGEGAGVAGLLDQVALAEGGEDDDRGPPLAGDLARPPPARPCPGILMSRMARSGSSSRDQLDGLVAAAGLAHDLVALLLEDLLEVEADDGLVLRDDDAHGQVVHSFGSRYFDLCDEPVEQLVLGSLELLRSTTTTGARCARHRIGVLLGLVVLAVGERGLRHQGPQARLVGGLGEEGQLLVDDRELGLRAASAARRPPTDRRSSNQRDMAQEVYGLRSPDAAPRGRRGLGRRAWVRRRLRPGAARHSPETVAAVLEAMGATEDGPPAPPPGAGTEQEAPAAHCPLPANAPRVGLGRPAVRGPLDGRAGVSATSATSRA